MNLLWTVIIVTDVALLLFVDPSRLLVSITAAGRDALALSFSLTALYFFWLGVMNIVNECALTQKLSNAVKPLIDKLYGKVSDVARGYIALNVASNLLGVGSAATPAALSAIEEINKSNKSDKLPKSLAMIFVVSATSIQLLPTTVMGLRAEAGSVNAADIVLPTLIATLFTTLLGIALTCLLYKND